MQLDRLEFRSCLISLGYDIPQVPEAGKDQEFERVLSRVDPNSELCFSSRVNYDDVVCSYCFFSQSHTSDDGVVSFDEYIAFMGEEHADAETSAQLVEAFKTLAAGQEYVTKDQLFKDLDPALAQYCVDNMAPFAGGPPGALDYKSFSSALYGSALLDIDLLPISLI